MKIIWSPTALGDLDRLQAYMAERDPAAAGRMHEAVFDSVEDLVRFPARGRPGRVPGTRELVAVGTPFVVPYRLEGQRIEIIAVLHGARRRPPE